nr:MAG TPA: chromosome partitioning protein [Caudoviricetes sp.]
MQQITQISTEVLRVHPRNQEFFDDIEGKAYEQFKESIKNEGVVTPLIVAPDMTIVSGHQRLKACEDLGIKKVPVIIREDLDDEDEKLKKLLATNFGRTKNDPAKQVKVAAEYVGLVGMKHGGSRAETHLLNYDDISDALGISKSTLKELLLIDRKLIPQIRELFDNGEITKYTANKVWCRLSPEDQERFFNEIGRDKISQMTQAQTQKYIDDLRRVEIEKQQLQVELRNEKNRKPEIKKDIISFLKSIRTV